MPLRILFYVILYQNNFSRVNPGQNIQETHLKEYVVGCHTELTGVKHQAFSEQGEQAMTQHDLRFPPDQDIREGKGQ